MKSPSLHSLIGLAALAAFPSFGCGSGAESGSTPETEEPASESTVEPVEASHCVQHESGEACFSSFRTALAFATAGGATTEPALLELIDELGIGPSDMPEGVPTLKSSVVHAIVYPDADYRGTEKILASSRWCTGAINTPPTQTVQFRDGEYWNDRISSFRSYGGCFIDLAENYNCAGAHFSSGQSKNYVGAAMNDETSCIRIY